MIRVLECVRDETRTTEYIVTSLISVQGATPSQVKRKREAKYGQACYHYSSAIRVNNQWAALTCPPEAATSSTIREKDSPAYCLSPPVIVEWYSGGEASNAQPVRLLSNKQNQAAGNGMWWNLCFREPLAALPDRVIRDRVAAARTSSTVMDGKQVYDDGLWDTPAGGEPRLPRTRASPC
ncbi:hypothetical protein N657DRAFT_706293 [Parathielavia appendiculata]|uniref:Uncharacterized protein n=1 Tax=Parathielavia appendiculata TaxID=2587402 RepID=A0AAN6YZC4_9PEZI|nr:hypothetical protein N657DRAFT_706293 [Parathielavia appendiculata]